MRRTFITTATAVLTLAAGTAAMPHASAAASAVDISSRSAALTAYKSTFLTNAAVASGSTGNPGTCSAGTMSAGGQSAALNTINYFRTMNGLKPATLNAPWSADAQRAALMMAANGTLDHHPTTAWRCASAAGITSAGRSNLDAGASTPGVSIGRYMDDSGNADTLGHRRWVLEPGLSQVGVGQVGQYGAMQWTGNGYGLTTPAGSPAYVAWPSAGYVPRALVPSENTWSFSASDAGVDMSGTSVKVTSNGASVPVTVTHLNPNYGKPAVEFKPGTRYAGGADKAYTVTITGMKKAGKTLPAYTYTTKLFDETYASSPSTTTMKPQPAANGVFWNAPSTVKVGQSIPLNPTFSSGRGDWSSSMNMTAKDVCAYSGSSIVFKAKGTCTVSIRQEASELYTAGTFTKTITVG